MPKISALPPAASGNLTDELAGNQSGTTRSISLSQLPAAIEGIIDHTAILNVGINPHTTIDAHLSDMANPHAVTKAQVGLGDVEDLKVNLTAIIAPVVGDDNTLGYSVGSRWIDTVTTIEYVALDVSTGAAVWDPTTTLDIAGLPVQSPITATDEVPLSDAGTNKKFALSVLAPFIEPDIDHTGILNIGTNSHSVIDTHLASVVNPHSVTKTQVGLSEVPNLKVNLTAVVPPTVNDDNTLGYAVGSTWFDISADKMYGCLDVTTGAAVWGWLNSIAESHLIVSPGNNIASANDPYASAGVSTNGTANFSFQLPMDFVSITMGQVFCIPAATASGLDIDILVNNASAGELFNANSASDTTSTYSFTASTVFVFNITSLLSGIGPGQIVGIHLDHNAIGQTVQYVALHIHYSRF